MCREFEEVPQTRTGKHQPKQFGGPLGFEPVFGHGHVFGSNIARFSARRFTEAAVTKTRSVKAQS
jgi:hypothetical protein